MKSPSEADFKQGRDKKAGYEKGGNGLISEPDIQGCIWGRILSEWKQLLYLEAHITEFSKNTWQD